LGGWYNNHRQALVVLASPDVLQAARMARLGVLLCVF